jgi:hypothetical protein
MKTNLFPDTGHTKEDGRFGFLQGGNQCALQEKEMNSQQTLQIYTGTMKQH